MVNEILECKCGQIRNRFQSSGDVATYKLEISSEVRKVVKVKKIDADCVKHTLKIVHKIADSFFYLKKGGKSQIQEKWILVETKGDKIKVGIEQLEKSLELFSDSKSPIHGRLVLTNVPNVLASNEANLINTLQERFVKRGGNFRRRNKILVDKITLSKSKFNIE